MRIYRTWFSSIFIFMFSQAWFGASPSAIGAQLALSIFDADTGELIPARVRIRDQAGKDCAAPSAQLVKLGINDQWFISDGQSRFDVPSGRIEVRVEHGKEYRPFKQIHVVEESSVNQIRVELLRWINMRRRGYVCGENHLHVSPQDLGPQLAAEGLDFGTSLQWWNRPVYKVTPGKGFVRFLSFAGRTMPSSVFDYEIEHIWGSVYVLGQPEALNAESDSENANLPLIRASHQAGALVCYQSGWSREVLLDALLGQVDVVNVCNNNFHRHMFQTRSQYSNLLNVEGFEIYPDDPVGMMRMNTDAYYRLLNCGLRLAAGAGSATGVKGNPVGYNRAYVRAGDHPTLPEVYEAWRAGRNFVTNGPMIFLTVNGKYKPGDTIEFEHSGGRIAVDVEAISDQPLTSIEIVVNGKVIKQQEKLIGQTGRLSLTTTITEGSWIAARCTDEDRLLSDQELAAYDTGPKAFACRPCRLRFAHTSPIYITVAGKGPRIASSISEAARMLDAFELLVKKTAKGDHQQEMLGEIDKARILLGR